MKSTWICSRNDLIANGSVLISAAVVGIIQNKWPDLIVGALISVVFIKSAASVIADSLHQLKIIKSVS